MKVEREYMDKRDEMILEVSQKEQNKKLVTRQKEGPFQIWENIQQFQSNGNNFTKVTRIINYELPTTGKI
jgi:ribosome-associated toxin RatA of RatAB toxin-antitoxin module